MFSSKFSNKCKQAAKCIRARVEPITKKKQATLRILKKDVADLLAAGRDDNAFGRIDALIVETNHTSCYDTIDKCCEYIVRQLPSLEKQRECSPEVMEVMGTLVFAAARFPDLPELCDLRRVFMERYGGDMQSSANAEFVEKLGKKTFSKEKKLQLMQSIAEEFSVRWDSRMFDHKLSNSPASKSDPTKRVVPSNADNKSASTIASQNNNVIPSRDRIEHTQASLPRGQQIPEEANVVKTVPASRNVSLHDQEKKKSKAVANGPESVEQYASRLKVAPNVNSRSSYNVTRQEDEPKDSIRHSRRRPKAQDELDSADQDKQRIYLDEEPARLVPPYTRSSVNKNCDRSIEGARGNGMPPYAEADETPNAYAVKEDMETALENAKLFGHHEQRSEPPREGSQSVQPANNNAGVANVIPPYYVKSAKQVVVQADSLIRSSNVADDSKDNNTEVRDDKRNGYNNVDKPKPVSVRRTFRNLPARETNATVLINEEKPRSYDDYYDGGRRRPTTVYDRDRNYYDEQVSDSRSAMEEGGVANVVGHGRIPMPRTSRVQKKEGNKHVAADVVYDDGKYDDDMVNNEKTTEQKATSKQTIKDDNAIDYGNLFARTSSNGRSRHHGSWHPAAAADDDEEMSVDRLLMHYSRKGKERRDPGQGRRKTGFEHPSNIDGGATGFEHHHQSHVQVVVPPSRGREANPPPLPHPPPERALSSVPPEPVGPEAIKTPARTVSLQPNCGRVHPRLPDFDNLAARLAALRNL